MPMDPHRGLCSLQVPLSGLEEARYYTETMRVMGVLAQKVGARDPPAS